VSGRSRCCAVALAVAGAIVLSCPVCAQVSSSVTLGATPNPSNLGQAVTLTAAVTSGATGKVTFYDGTNVIGTRTISSGQAVLTTVLLPSGVQSLHAHYLGDSTYASSNSAAVMQTVVAEPSLGLKPPVTYPAGTSPEPIAMGDFNGDGRPDLVVGDYNGSNVSVLLGNGDGTFQAPVPYSVQPGPISLVVADFNDDGKADLAVAGYSGGISILIGNGDGTFQPAVTVESLGGLLSLAVADFNGDGKADLATCSSTNVAILLGNGDGTFGEPSNTVVSSADAIVVGDFNGDGKPDVAVASYSFETVTILTGKGDGTLQAGAVVNLGAYPVQITAGDFNEDGFVDLAASVYGGSSLAVLIGKGDGTFQSPVLYGGTDAYNGESIAVGDFNGDGIPDLAVGQIDLFGVTVFYGSGNGIFAAGPFYALIESPFSIVVGDFNGDGKTDLAATTDLNNGSVMVWLGGAVPDLSVEITHGSGFTQGQIGASYAISVTNVGQVSSVGSVGVVDTLPSGFTATAISGSGWTCVLQTLACARSDSLAGGSSYPNIVITVNVAANLTGSATDTATVSGGGDRNPSNNTATDTTTVRLATGISLTSAPNPSTLGQPVMMAATITSAATGKITFLDGTTILGDAQISGGQASLTTVLLASGTRSLIAEYSGDSVYGPEVSAIHTQTVTEAAIDGLQPLQSYKTDTTPEWVADGDFNGDGKIDLVTANYGTSDISVLLGNGDGTFQTARNYTVPSTPSMVLSADFNGDGKADLAVVGYSAIYVLLGNGDGTFQTPAAYAVNADLNYIVIADFNRDGIPDIAGSSGSTVSVLLGNGDGTFQSAVNSPMGVSPITLILADFNGDGKPDLLCASSSTTVSVLLGNGDGTFQGPSSISVGQNFSTSYVVGDFNGDGKADIGYVSGDEQGVFLGNGDGTFQGVITSSVSANTPGYLAIVGDFNGDGKLDIAYRGYYSNYFAIVFGTGNGTFSASASFVTDGYGQTASGNLITADFNRDGKPDIAVANPYQDGGGTPNVVDIFLGGQFSGLNITSTHTGYYTAGQTGATYQLTVSNPNYNTASSNVTVTDTLPAGLTATAISGNYWTCTLISLTCTQTASISSGNSYSPITVTVNVFGALPAGTITNHASVSEAGIVNTASDPTLIVLPTTTTLNVSPSGSNLGQPITLTATVTAGATGTVSFRDDVILLGVAPIVSGQASFTTTLLAAGTRSLLAVYPGDASHASNVSAPTPLTVKAAPASGLLAATTSPTGTGPAAIAVADFNLDGIADLVTANMSGSISILLGNGNGTFRPSVNYPAGSKPMAVAVGDFNGDGKPDVAVVNQSVNTVTVLLGNGDGTFQAPASYPTGNGPVAVAVADFNGDGIADLAIANATDSTVSVLFGVGNGSFQAGKVVNVIYTPSALAVADFNGDGKADLLISASYGYITTWLGNGDGTFSEGFFNPQGASTVAGDLNGDGKTDIVEANSTTLTVLLGEGTGSFQGAETYPLSMGAIALAIADVNGDGKLDVIAAGGSSLAVLLGNGDGTLQVAVSYSLISQPSGIVAANFDGDARTDVAIVSSTGSNVSTFLGVLTPVLEVFSTHVGNFAINSTGVYTLTVMNEGPGVTSGTVTLVDTLPTGITGNSMSGTGWTCTVATLTCTRSDALGVGVSYPSISLTVNVGPSVVSPAVNMVMASGGGSVAATGSDTTIVNSGPPFPMLSFPSDGAQNINLTPVLTWASSAGATSYDVYFGASSPPPLIANLTVTSYAPAGLVRAQTYYWQVVAKNSGGSNASPIWSFSTQPTAAKVGIFRSGFFWLLDTDGNRQWDDPPDQAFAYGGIAGDIPITGDWTGDGHTKAGIYRAKNGDFILDSNGNEVFDAGDAVYKFLQNVGGPQPGDVPVVGDWNGSGTSKIGIVRDGFLWLLDLNGDGIYEPGTDLQYVFGGAPGDIPVVGDWTGTGTTKIGVLRDGFLWLLDANGNGTWDGTAGGDYAFAFGAPGDVPVVGDWTGDGVSKVGMYRDGFLWVLDSDDPAITNATGQAPLIVFAFGGVAGDVPIVGKWFAPPASITATGGTPQSTAIETGFPTPLSLVVTGVDGYGVSGITMQFTAPASGASATFAGGATTAVTHAAGSATSALPSANGTTGGPYSVTASVVSCGTYPGCGPVTPASFSLTNTPTPAQQPKSK